MDRTRILISLLLLSSATVVACGLPASLAGTPEQPVGTVDSPSPATLAPSDPPEPAVEIDGMMPGLLAQYNVPGAAVALVRDGQTVWVGCYGLADGERGIPVTPDTVFQVASISKSVTAWEVMRLVEEGVLDLDAPVKRYLTRWQLPPSEFDADGVTIRRLLSHTAGLSLSGYPGFGPAQPLPSLEESLSGATNGSGDVRVIYPPGTQYSYSGGGYTVLQLIIEEVTGESFVNVMQRAVLQPLGMRSSGYEWASELRSATAQAYDENGQPLPNFLFTAKAAAGLYTTVDDLARFVAAATTGASGEPAGRGVLSPQTLEQMFTPAAATNSEYGLGYGVDELEGGIRIVTHGGHNTGWQARFALQPEMGEGIVILTNGDTGWGPIVDVMDVWRAWLVDSSSAS